MVMIILSGPARSNQGIGRIFFFGLPKSMYFYIKQLMDFTGRFESESKSIRQGLNFLFGFIVLILIHKEIL